MPRRSARNRKTPERNDFITRIWWEVDEALYSCSYNILGEPKSIDEALNSSARSEWKKALDNELEILTNCCSYYQRH